MSFEQIGNNFKSIQHNEAKLVEMHKYDNFQVSQNYITFKTHNNS